MENDRYFSDGESLEMGFVKQFLNNGRAGGDDPRVLPGRDRPGP